MKADYEMKLPGRIERGGRKFENRHRCAAWTPVAENFYRQV
jgi:hypothetical protein